MRSLRHDMETFGGIARRGELIALGYSPHALKSAIASGRLKAPRRGWIADVGAPTDALRAVTLGGRLGGASVLRLLGIWVDEPGPLEVCCHPRSSRLPTLRKAEFRTWKVDRFPERGCRPWRVSVRDAILQHAVHASRSELVAVIDSALHLRRMTRAQLIPLLDALPQAVRPKPSDIDGRSMSGTESHLRFALRAAGYRVETQVYVAGVGTVDLMVDGWFITECDSRQFHGKEADQEHDRRRDGNAALIGHPNARFTYTQVMHDRDWCVRVVEAGLLRGQPTTAINRMSYDTTP